MLSSPSARSSSDLSFFSPSKVSKSGASTPSPVVVTTRLAKRPVPTAGPSDVPREVKRHRTASAKEALSKRKSNTSSKNPSRATSRQRTLPPSPEPIYRSSRSRSTSLFPGPEPETDTHQRQWRSDDNGIPGEAHLSSEMVVKRLMKSYKSCEPLPGMRRQDAADCIPLFPEDFKNVDDPNDKTFDPHPTEYPVVELEYPNTGASERCVYFFLWSGRPRSSFVLTPSQVHSFGSKGQGPL